MQEQHDEKEGYEGVGVEDHLGAFFV